jgi:outer membrane receptor protein involved in Fe transport
MSRETLNWTTIVGVPGIAWLLAGTAGAQTAPHADSGQLEEITVTAEKRESTVESTPISITAVSGADIAARGLTDLGSLLQSVPGVSIRTSGPGLSEFEMRGAASTGGNSPTVGFYYDDVPLTAPADANEGKVVISPQLYDLNRVEVLRGPQGTLYGSGSMGGTIKLVPNAPNSAAFDASAEAVASDTANGGFNYAENTMVNLPIVAGLAAVRIVGSYESDAGWINRVVAEPGTFPLPTGGGTVRGNVLAAPDAEDYHGVNDLDRTTVRISALITPAEGLSIAPSFLYQKMVAGGLPYIDSVPGTNAHYQPFDIPENYSDEFKLGDLNLKYRTDLFEVNSTSAYWTRHEPIVQDASESWATPFLFVPPPLGPYVTSYYAPGGLGPSTGVEDLYSHQTSEELRFASVGDSNLKWLIGYFYSDFESDWNVNFPAANAGIFGSNQLFTYLNPTKLLQQSVFGELTYNITPAFAATAGLRRYTYDEGNEINQSGPLATAGITGSAVKAQGVTPKFSLSYAFSPDLLVYTTAAKGFRPGGGTGPVPTSGAISCETDLQNEYGTTSFVPGPTSFNSDHLWSYELGEKLRAADNRVTINSALYFESWTGVQQTNALPKCGYIYTANAGNAHVYGGEIEIQALIVHDLIASVNTGYVHAALVSTDLLNAGFNPGTPIQDDPKWTASASLAYRHGLTDGLAFTSRIDGTYVGSRTDETYGINTLPSYQLVNLRAGVEADAWSATLFVDNVTNKRALLSDITQAAENLPDFNRIAVNQPLTVGVDLNYRFGR